MPASASAGEQPHRTSVRLLVVLASLLAFLSIFTTWIDRQALDTGAWVDTSGRLLENEQVSDAVATYAVDQLYANVDIAGLLQRQLPRDFKQISGPVAGGLREVATRAAEKALRTGRIQVEWKTANRLAHQTLLRILEGGNAAVSTEGGRVVLDLRPLVEQVATRVGVDPRVAEAIPADAARLEILRSDELSLAQTIARAVKGLALLFSLGTLALFALAAYLARGWRWMVALGYGLGLIAAAVAALALRKVAGGLVVDDLLRNESARPAAEATWAIGTSLLVSIATTALAYGALFVLASFLASPAERALTVRQALAPSLRDRPAAVWSAFAAAVFLALILSPPRSLRELVATTALVALAAAGLEALRRKTAREFPDALRGEWRVRMRQRAREARREAARRIEAAITELTDDRDPADARLERLERLAALHDRGVLDDAEFDAEKKRLLES
ncbi:MAG: hypothetical protein QOJ38_209 [Solirubrobacterales bacterium]|jgi:hypothetical protein|nr:hypothetical protein [Solirubrobacterales bacterium]